MEMVARITPAHCKNSSRSYANGAGGILEIRAGEGWGKIPEHGRGKLFVL